MCIHLSCSPFHYITLHMPLKPTSLVFIIVTICMPCFTIWYYLFIFPSWNAPILTFVKHCSFLFLPSQYSFSFALRISVSLRSPCSSLTSHPLPLLLPYHNADDPSIIFTNSALYCIYQDLSQTSNRTSCNGFP